MEQDSTPLAAPRRNADYRWTAPKALAFLEALASHGKVASAARSVGMTAQSAYRLKARSGWVAKGWPLAQAAGKKRRLARGRQRHIAVWTAQGDGLGVAR